MDKVATKKSKYIDLGRAINIAAIAHGGQFDKGGKPYILHPLHLMDQLMYDIELATIAVLHDVPEDSDFDIEYLRGMNFTERVLEGVALLTHHAEDDYDTYIEKLSGNLDAVLVKRKDLEHNSDITRLKEVRDKDLDRIEKYHRAFLRLGTAKVKLQQ